VTRTRWSLLDWTESASFLFRSDHLLMHQSLCTGHRVDTAVRKAASQLQRLGAKVEEVSIPEHHDAWPMKFTMQDYQVYLLLKLGL
jgi:Asp-tRNA(Asn)/Glu-tRNA(Gln) amidotransferase A subunit family amidase